MKAPLELKYCFALCAHIYFLGGVRPVLELFNTCANGSNDSVFLLHLPTLLHVVAGTPVPK